jgi:organic hydroperoxide reductase OsmC/OhrA
VSGEIGKDQKVLVIRRIHVKYRLEAEPEHRQTIERVHAMHARHCPVARSIEGCIAIATELELV